MDVELLKKRLTFIEHVERLKSTLRTGCSATGRNESTAEHSWRLALMAMVYADALCGVDPYKLLKMCIIHDLGEAVSGDVPALQKTALPNHHQQERADVLELVRHLDAAAAAQIIALYDEYEAGHTPESKAAKALDRLETILQHTQGSDQPDVQFDFNLSYGRVHTDHFPELRYVRSLLDERTLQILAASA
ncbi:HD domain-containing protein [Pseudomonas sp. RP23018S]|uniref:HD domain-containing protein n=1 Tax=Pseudomonas sp. RP23018S TaxID=3096037 RepID=UPI002ACAB41E|nr:HD domain-containing protein [Pseudomonas sp. RP23018S]MDZ5603802.1 HD domain-containing protein [Pseudomonas sp. RP23018S]